jgi:type I pantothenate kinase
MAERDLGAELVALVAARAAERARDPGAFLLGVAGGVAAGKSTLAQFIAEGLARTTPDLGVQVVPTDGFLRSNRELEAAGLTGRKGFPESYDAEAFRAFLDALAAGQNAAMPVYSHVTYDIVPEASRTVVGAGVVIVEGINVLQTAEARAAFGLSLYVDAEPAHMHAWYLRRLDEIVAREPHSLIAQIRDPEQRRAIVEAVWRDVNLVNLRDHIAPTAAYADLVVRKAADHAIAELVATGRRLSPERAAPRGRG